MDGRNIDLPRAYAYPVGIPYLRKSGRYLEQGSFFIRGPLCSSRTFLSPSIGFSFTNGDRSNDDIVTERRFFFFFFFVLLLPLHHNSDFELRHFL